MEASKEKSYVMYDEPSDLISDEFPGGRDLGDLLTDFDGPDELIDDGGKLDFDKKVDDEFTDLDLNADFSDKTNDPVRMYLREMGTVPLLTREGEIELAKRIERGQAAVRKALSRSALVIREILAMPEIIVTDENIIEQANELIATVAEIEKHYKKAQQFRQKLQAISRGMKPKMHHSIRWSLARTMVNISRLIRGIHFSSMTRRTLAGRLRTAVEDLRPIEREIARIQRKLESP